MPKLQLSGSSPNSLNRAAKRCDLIQRLSTLALEALGIALLDFSELADLVVWLQQQEVSD